VYGTNCLLHITSNTRRSVFFQIMLLRKEGSPYFQVLKNKYEEDDYEA
jgi:hypothetical protein